MKRVLTTLKSSIRTSFGCIGTMCLLMLLSLVLGTSCVKDHIAPIIIDDIEERTINLQFNTPYSIPKTRAIDGAAENAIQAVDVFAFKVDGAGVETFDYYVQGFKDGTQYKAKVKVKEYDQRFVVITNAHDKSVALANLHRGRATEREVMLADLTVSLTAGTKWDATSDTQYDDLPMYGESAKMVVTETTTSMGTINLVRMVVRVNVQIANSLVTSNKFKLRSVNLYNSNTSGRISPIIDGLNSYFDRSTNKANKPSLPSGVVRYEGPLEYTDFTAPGTVDEAMRGAIFTFEALTNTTDYSKRPCLVIGGVFDGEVDGSGNEEITYYRVEFLDTDKVTFLNVLRNHSYLFDILDVSQRGYPTVDEAFRAHPVDVDYVVKAWEDSGMGHVVTDGQYFLSVSELDYEFYREGESEETAYNVLHILTDYSTSSVGATSGWYVSKIVDAANEATVVDWLTMTPDKGVAGTKTKVVLSYKRNDSGADRTAYVYLRAGRIEQRITVTQKNDIKSIIVITNENGEAINRVLFASAVGVAPAEQTFKVKWSPTSSTLSINASDVYKTIRVNYPQPVWGKYLATSKDGLINIDSAPNIYVTDIDNVSGEMTFVIRPTAIAQSDLDRDLFYERQVDIKFSLTASDGATHQTINIQQLINTMTVTPAKYFCLLTGSKDNEIMVKSNIPWKLVVTHNNTKLDNSGNPVVQNASVGTVLASGGYNLPFGTNVYYETFKDFGDGVVPSLYKGDFKVELQSQSGELLSTDDHRKSVVCASAIPQKELSNSYILDPTTGVGILIPVARAGGYRTVADFETDTRPDWRDEDTKNRNELDILMTEDTGFSVSLVWSDVSDDTGTKGLDPTALIQLLEPIGKGLGGHVLIMPGEKQKMGNALISIKSKTANKLIIWTWHIWVTDYWPYSGDRIEQKAANAHGNPSDGHDTRKLWMNRNLGATSQTPGEWQTKGLHYQWGRITPFANNIKEWNISGLATIWNATGSVQYSEYSGYFVQGITGSIFGSLGFANITKAPYDWLARYPENQREDLWDLPRSDGGGSSKTIYDPCPVGWRVPVYVDKAYDDPTNTKFWGNNSVSIPWSTLDTTWESYGVIWPETANIPYKGGYYPTTGWREGIISAELINRVAYHTASTGHGLGPSFTAVKVLAMSNLGVNILYTQKFKGLPVRCVTE